MKIFSLVLFVTIAVGCYLGGFFRNASHIVSNTEVISNEPQASSQPSVAVPTAQLLKPIVQSQVEERLSTEELITLEKKRTVEESDIIESRDAAGEIFKKQGLIE